MKRLSRKDRLYRIRITANRERRAKRKREGRRVDDIELVFEVLEAPIVFGLEDPARKETIRFLRRLTNLVLKRDKWVRIDFRNTKLMTMPGTLLFAAELSRIIALAKLHRVRCFPAAERVVHQVLQHVGIYKLLRHEASVRIEADNVKYWKVHSGDVVKGETVGKLMAGYKDLFSDRDRRSLYASLVEAMINCRHHAYREARGDGFDNVTKWWAFSQLKDDKLTVGVCDLGMGIPRSLRRNERGLFEFIRGILQNRGLKEDDGTVIQGAIELGRTRTMKKHRGKGLNEIRRVLDALKGTLQIHSNCGRYDFHSTKPTGEQEDTRCFKEAVSIRGTLIVWQIPVPEPIQRTLPFAD